MTVLTEGNLQLTVNGAVTARKFDNSEHGLSHCMKAVDFIVELPDSYLYIEFKDPQHPTAPSQQAHAYEEQFKSGLFDEDLKYNYRDTFLYEWASGRADKPVDYFVLIALDTLADSLLLSRGSDLERKLPVLGPGMQPWPKPIVRSCSVFNLGTWNRHFPDYPITRLT